jgi:hypothetical protein
VRFSQEIERFLDICKDLEHLWVKFQHRTENILIAKNILMVQLAFYGRFEACMSRGSKMGPELVKTKPVSQWECSSAYLSAKVHRKKKENFFVSQLFFPSFSYSFFFSHEGFSRNFFSIFFIYLYIFYYYHHIMISLCFFYSF